MRPHNIPRGHFATFRPPSRQYPPHSPPFFKRPYSNFPQRPRLPFRPNRPNRPFPPNNRPFPPTRRINRPSFPQTNHFASLNTQITKPSKYKQDTPFTFSKGRSSRSKHNNNNL